jgi:hypothetical protein
MAAPCCEFRTFFFAVRRAHVDIRADIKFYGTHTTTYNDLDGAPVPHSHPRGGERILGGALFAASDASKSHTRAAACCWV